MRLGGIYAAQCMGLLSEDELHIQDAPLADVLAMAASRAQREAVDEDTDVPDSERPTTPAPR